MIHLDIHGLEVVSNPYMASSITLESLVFTGERTTTVVLVKARIWAPESRRSMQQNAPAPLNSSDGGPGCDPPERHARTGLAGSDSVLHVEEKVRRDPAVRRFIGDRWYNSRQSPGQMRSQDYLKASLPSKDWMV